jgi:hypothetical protein
MEEMRLPLTIRPQRFVCLLLAWILLLSCSWLPLPAGVTPPPVNAPKQATGEATRASSQAVPGAETVTPGIEETGTTEPDPLDRLLAMRSIKFNLTSLKWDGSSHSIDVEIDSAGNMHVKHSPPVIDPALLPNGFDPKMLPPSHEVYVVDGKAYHLSEQNPDWITTPVYENYIQMLAQEMHGPDGPAIWLDMLPAGSIHAAGKDNVGGFGADKYTVNGQIDGQSISGTIWFEPQADALVQAELHIPASLLSDPTQPQKGELKISLNAQKANVPLVSLPAAPAD